MSMSLLSQYVLCPLLVHLELKSEPQMYSPVLATATFFSMYNVIPLSVLTRSVPMIIDFRLNIL